MEPLGQSIRSKPAWISPAVTACCAWLNGGLDFQIEHPLRSRMSVLYPLVVDVVDAACREHGIRYRTHRRFPAGMAWHYRWLRRLAMPVNAISPALVPVTRYLADRLSPRFAMG